ncbi:MAG: ASKHA domain-containing protein, partial [Desulfuromonadaceae bacterium]|nr:ASKHA domain-containing protein [Desulfuromonadaceae bacterium]
GVYLFPMPGGFVGGDTVAFIYGAEPGDAALCLDMGTNGEIVLTDGGTIWATSAAAGPAFEGGNLSCGMAALPGAISSVRIEGERLRLQVIGNGAPSGICGSGVIEAVTELLRCNILEAGGRLRSPGEIESNLAARMIDYRGSSAFILHRDAQRLIVLSQEDIRQLQLAKAAIRGGIEVLAERSRIQCNSLNQVVLTGSFGAVVRPEWLKTIGIFDGSMVQTTRFTPEGALAGVEKALAAGDGFNAVEVLAHRFRVVPLSGTPLFETLFMRHIDFPAQ